jgi:hypothetical protein
MENILSILNVFLVLSIIGIIFYFIDRKLVNKKYYSAYKKAYDYVFLTLKEEDRDRVLKNLKEYQKEIYENSQFILTDSLALNKSDLEKKREDLEALSEKLSKDKIFLISQVDKIHNEVTNEDIEKAYDKLKEEITYEILNLTKLINEKEEAINQKIKNNEDKNAKLKTVEFATKSINEYSNLIMLKLQNLANLLPFYMLTAVEYLISYDFFSQLLEANKVEFYGYVIELKFFIPFLVTTILLVAIDLSINFAKEKKDSYSLVTGLFAFALFFIIAYSRISPQLDGDPQLLLLEIIKLGLFAGVIGLNYFLMEKYNVKSEELIFAPFQLVTLVFELVVNTVLKASTTGAKVASKNINIDKITFENEIKKLKAEIDVLKDELNSKNSKRNELFSKKDQEISKRKNSLTVELKKRLDDISSQANFVKSELQKLDKKHVKSIELDSQIRDGSYDGTTAAVKKFFKLK